MFATNRLTLTVGWSQSGSDSVSGTTNQLVMVEMTHDTVDIKALLCNYLACRIATLTRVFSICTKRFDPSAARIRALQSRRALPLLLRVKSTSRASDAPLGVLKMPNGQQLLPRLSFLPNRLSGERNSPYRF